MARELWTEPLSKYQPLARAAVEEAVKDPERNFPAVFPSLYPQAVCWGQRGVRRTLFVLAPRRRPDSTNLRAVQSLESRSTRAPA